VPLDIELKPIETLVYRSDTVAFAKFRCPAGHPLFRDSGPCGNHVFVFPRSSTEIEHAGGPRFVGGPNTISIYNRGQVYFRRKLSDIDASDWFTVADDMLLDAISAWEPSVRDRPHRPFRVAFAPADPRLYIEQRALFESVQELEPLEIEERVLRILRAVLQAAYAMPPRRRRLRDAVETAKSIIDRDPAATVPLRTLAAQTGSSPFQLCRSFRASTGMTLTAYRHALRLRRSLDRLRDPRTDLTDLALELGYSSHSHFTFAFRRQFGITPSAYRAKA
jgi:AraC family transcriptional regulator